MYLGVDIGGTKTLLGLFTDDGKLKEKFRFETPQKYETFLSVFRRHVEPLLAHDIKAIGVGVPGLLDREHGIGRSYGNLPWKKVPIQKDIEAITSTPVIIENDANLAGLSEARNLKGDFKKVLFFTISTGIGTGFITNGVIDDSLANSEGGHIVLEYNGKPTLWEDFASGKAIEQHFGKQAHDIHDEKTWKTIAHNIARGMIQHIAILQPDIIVVGGGVGTHFGKFDDLLRQELKKFETPLTPIPPMRRAARPEEAVLYGCYEMLKDNYARTS